MKGVYRLGVICIFLIGVMHEIKWLIVARGKFEYYNSNTFVY